MGLTEREGDVGCCKGNDVEWDGRWVLSFLWFCSVSRDGD
jgi:hypothetical protein